MPPPRTVFTRAYIESRSIPEPMSERHFDVVFGEHRLTPAERAALVWHLAALRFQRTIEALLSPTKPAARRRVTKKPPPQQEAE